MSTLGKAVMPPQDQDNVLLIAGVLIAFGVFIKVLPLILVSFLIALVLNAALRGKNGSFKRFYSTIVILGLIFFISIGIPKNLEDSAIRGSLFHFSPEFLKFIVGIYADIYAQIPIEYFHIKRVTHAQVQTFVWLTLPLSLGLQFFIGKVSKPDAPLMTWLDKSLSQLFTFPILRNFENKNTSSLESGVFLGKFKNSKRDLVLSEKALGHHVYILGASGFGKSVCLQKVIKDRISKGHGLMYLDLKSDDEILSDIKSWCKEAGRQNDLQIFDTNHPENSIHYNPLRNGNYTEIKDLIMGSLEWSEPFYKNTCEDFLLRILEPLTVLRDSGEFTLDLPSLLDCIVLPNLLVDLASRLPVSRVDLKQELGEAAKIIKNKENFKLLSSLQVQLRSIIKTNFGRLLNTDVIEIDLFEAAKSSKIIVFMLDSRRFGKSVKSLGKIILQDLKAVSSRIGSEIKEDERRLFTPIIDEFSDLATPEFLSFLDRARSSKMGTVICHQEMMDLGELGDHYAKRLVNLTSTQLIFNSKNPETCDYFASVIGTETITKETERAKSALFLGNQRTGDRSLREAESFSIHPNTFRSLEVGQCVWITKYPKSDFGLCRISFNT